MILDIIEFILSPIIWLLSIVFGELVDITGSAGFSVILLAVAVSLTTLPLRNWAIAVENKVTTRMKAANEQIANEAEGLKGEARFRVLERVYSEHNYSPIMNIALGLSFFVVLPFLLAALFLFHDNTELAGKQFLIVSDLSKPDGLLSGGNLLPIIMSTITMIDAFFRYGPDRGALIRFGIISVILLVLVYELASALVLYWTASNVVSFCLSIMRRLIGKY